MGTSSPADESLSGQPEGVSPIQGQTGLEEPTRTLAVRPRRDRDTRCGLPPVHHRCPVPVGSRSGGDGSPLAQIRRPGSAIHRAVVRPLVHGTQMRAYRRAYRKGGPAPMGSRRRADAPIGPRNSARSAGASSPYSWMPECEPVAASPRDQTRRPQLFSAALKDPVRSKWRAQGRRP